MELIDFESVHVTVTYCGSMDAFRFPIYRVTKNLENQGNQMKQTVENYRQKSNFSYYIANRNTAPFRNGEHRLQHLLEFFSYFKKHYVIPFTILSKYKL
jgi:hypothetical protein